MLSCLTTVIATFETIALFLYGANSNRNRKTKTEPVLDYSHSGSFGLLACYFFTSINFIRKRTVVMSTFVPPNRSVMIHLFSFRRIHPFPRNSMLSNFNDIPIGNDWTTVKPVLYEKFTTVSMDPLYSIEFFHFNWCCQWNHWIQRFLQKQRCIN